MRSAALTWLPRDQVGRDHLSRLTFASKFDDETVITTYDDGGLRIGLPRAYAFEHFGVQGEMSGGFKIKCPKKPVARDEAQQKFFDNVLSAMVHHPDVVASAETGTGKTVCACNVIATIGRNALIIVHMERLAVQWRKEVQDKLGLRADEIGFVGDGEKTWQGKKVVIAMLQTLRNGGMPDAFYTNFGIVVPDELHRMGAPLSSEVLKMINARWRLGLTATPTRQDGLESVFFAHLGQVKVVAESKALAMTTYVKDFDCSWVEKWPGQFQVNKFLSRIPQRNMMLATGIKEMYDRGRQAIIVGEFIDHMHLMRDVAVHMGIPRAEIGMFMGQYLTTDHQGHIKKRMAKASELKHAKENCRLTFATIGMIKEGIDEPRWDAGMDLIPWSQATQLIGRVRRKFLNKKHPVWVTTRDRGCPSAEGKFYNRLREYHLAGDVKVMA